MARSIGIDLIDGRHDGFAAEAARRSGVELLRFPEWTRSEVTAFGQAQHQIAAEEHRDIARYEAVMTAMTELGASTIGGIPRDRLCRIFECDATQLDEVMNDAFAARWWHQ
jgi:hypothetical protein